MGRSIGKGFCSFAQESAGQICAAISDHDNAFVVRTAPSNY